MNKTSTRFMLAIILLVGTQNVSASVIALHSGSTDPTTEGWTFVGAGTGITTGAINDAGTPAWFVNDDSTVSGSIGMYQFDVNTSDAALGNSAGWSLSTTMRNVDVPDTESGSTIVIYRDGSTSWQLQFGSESDGDPVVLARTSLTNDLIGTKYVLQGAGNTFNTFQLVYDPLLGSADLFVNGIEQISDYSGFALTQTPTLFWGSGRSPDTGRGNYSSVSFSTSAVPIPSAAWLFGSGLLGLMGMARRKKA